MPSAADELPPYVPDSRSGSGRREAPCVPPSADRVLLAAADEPAREAGKLPPYVSFPEKYRDRGYASGSRTRPLRTGFPNMYLATCSRSSSLRMT